MTDPQAYSVIKVWKSRVRSVICAVARSTWASPRDGPAHRQAAPACLGLRRQIVADDLGHRDRFLGRRQVAGVVEDDQPTVAHAVGYGAHRRPVG